MKRVSGSHKKPLITESVVGGMEKILLGMIDKEDHDTSMALAYCEKMVKYWNNPQTMAKRHANSLMKKQKSKEKSNKSLSNQQVIS